jgi:hypothetical protein
MRIAKKQFVVFRTECERLHNLFRLSGWGMEVQFEDLGEENTASCTTDVCQRKLWISLNREWKRWDGPTPPSDARIRQSARHEMLHALTEPLIQMAASRFVTKDEVDEACHEVLQRLDPLLPR